MPKHTRSSSTNQNRYSNPMPVSLAPSAPMPIYSTRQQQQQQQAQQQAQQLSLNPGYYPTVPSSQAMQVQTYDPYPGVATASTAAVAAAAAVVTQPPMPHRASSGAWTPQDDQNLLQARQQGLNWAQIQSNYFPNKTPNACRKRHERLMERKGADDWDQRKLERMAKEYMSLRKEIWQPLAQRTGEKWNVVESMCMNNGLKNLQSAARSASRRERLETSGHPMHGYDDDSGISGIGLTPVDDQLDASYSSPASSGGSHHSSGGSSNAHSVGGYGSAYAMAVNGGHHPQQHHQHHHQQQQHHQTAYGAQGYTTTGSTGALSSSFSSSHSSNAAYHPHPHHQQQHHHHQHHQHPDDSAAAYMANGQRLSSVDMGIESIINRPAHNGGASIYKE
ncbi:hypothetical protein MGN70_003771 [Eutypa lata]|nr:hypothetical protein MGN70_003771 [Eutypa lata]